jgi:hypothetical protein
MMSCAQWTPEEGRKGGGQSGEGGDGEIPYVIIPSTHKFFHLTSGSTVMCSAPYNLYSVCALPPKLSKILWSSNQENFTPIAARLVVHRQTRELTLLQQTALRSTRLEVMYWVQAGSSCRPISTLLLGAAPHSRDHVVVAWEVAVW